MKVSLICTVKNEAEALPRLLTSLAAQTRAPDEIIIVDGGSTDATLEILREYAHTMPLQIISAPGANISQGRNIAIRAAHGEIICATDAGVRLDPNWVAELVAPFQAQKPPGVSSANTVHSSSVDVVSGFFVPDPHSVFETALAATTLPMLRDIVPEKFLPSSRSVAFRKAAWEYVGGYPEWLDYCEDLIFDFALRRAGFRFVFAPRARVYFRPRPNLRAFFRQYYHYARGDGKADLWLLRHLIRYTTYGIALPLTLALLFSGFWLLGIGILTVGFFGMFFTPYRRLLPTLRDFSWRDRARALAWVPIIRITGDVAKMLGYPVGVVWRWKHRKGAR